MSEVKKLLRRAMKHGFDLSAIDNFTIPTFRSGLFEHSVEKNFTVFEEDGELFVGYNIVDDVAKVSFSSDTMKVLPLKENGFFEILIELFRYITIACKLKNSDKSDDDISTESYSEEDSESEEIWL